MNLLIFLFYFLHCGKVHDNRERSRRNSKPRRESRITTVDVNNPCEKIFRSVSMHAVFRLSVLDCYLLFQKAMHEIISLVLILKEHVVKVVSDTAKVLSYEIVF